VCTLAGRRCSKPRSWASVRRREFGDGGLDRRA
jgi:hypothetical protein